MDNYGHAMCEKARDLAENGYKYSQLPEWDYRRQEWEAQRVRDNQEQLLLWQARQRGGSLYGALEAMDDGGRDIRRQWQERTERAEMEAARRLAAARGWPLWRALEALGVK
jgi:hypothetical protein